MHSWSQHDSPDQYHSARNFQEDRMFSPIYLSKKGQYGMFVIVNSFKQGVRTFSDHTPYNSNGTH